MLELRERLEHESEVLGLVYRVVHHREPPRDHRMEQKGSHHYQGDHLPLLHPGSLHQTQAVAVLRHLVVSGDTIRMWDSHQMYPMH